MFQNYLEILNSFLESFGGVFVLRGAFLEKCFVFLQVGGAAPEGNVVPAGPGPHPRRLAQVGALGPLLRRRPSAFHRTFLFRFPPAMSAEVFFIRNRTNFFKHITAVGRKTKTDVCPALR